MAYVIVEYTLIFFSISAALITIWIIYVVYQFLTP